MSYELRQEPVIHVGGSVTTVITTKGLLFDMDGVLISSIGSVQRCWRKWAAHYNLPNAEHFEFPHGVRAIEMIPQLTPHIDVQEGLRLIEDYEIEDVADLKVLPGVRELLSSLPPDRWAIVTSATRRLMDGRLRAAGLPVPERLITGDDVIHGKPHPEPYLRGAGLLGLSPKECIVVEDAPSGVGAGHAAGCRVLGVLGTHRAEELPGAEWLVDGLESVKVTLIEHGLELHLQTAD